MSLTRVSPTGWILRSITHMISLIILSSLLRNEYKQRKQSGVKFTTKLLKHTSISCIICGFTANLLWFLQSFDGFCIFGRWLGSVFMYLQFLSMGFYQLSRLYYCFANSKVYSKKGYPKSLFIIMIIIPIICMVNYSISNLLKDRTGLNNKCGVNTDLEYYSYSINRVEHENIVLISAMISFLVYIIWDIAILILYILKIRLFKNFEESQPAVYQRIMSILHKIVILTLLYEVTILASIIIFAAIYPFLAGSLFSILSTSILQNIASVSVAYSMCLMMDYNGKQYEIFLTMILRFKLHFICCKYRYMIIDQLNELVENEKYIADSINSDESNKTKNDSSVFSVKDEANMNNIPPIHMSVELTTDFEMDECV